MNILVSACLLGRSCRYDGKSKPCDAVMALSKKHDLIPVCPEMDGGLSCPRTPCERVGERVVSKKGEDRTAEYNKGAEIALETAKKHGCKYAIMKAKSPACSSSEIYDGSFSGTLIKGNGVAADLLIKNGITVLTEDMLSLLPEEEI
ncbi:MAG: DUF523 domain-containing protein [Oscillospiraceae bacterium]|nr:DUF523 domain-containing protein [Oscillospiraceae bacterium]